MFEAIYSTFIVTTVPCVECLRQSYDFSIYFHKYVWKTIEDNIKKLLNQRD
jgi:hypothetical protein